MFVSSHALSWRAAVAAVTEEDVRKTQLRKRRLHACMVNLIDANSQLYQVVTKTPFTNSGPSTYEYLWVAGHLERDRDETQRLHNEWSEASLHSCKIRINAQALYKWLEWCKLKAEILGFSEFKIRKDLLGDWPNTIKPRDSADPTWKVPPNERGQKVLIKLATKMGRQTESTHGLRSWLLDNKPE